MIDDDYKMIYWSIWAKRICKNVSTPTLKSFLERGNKKYKIGGADISYPAIDL
jgi:hypothetical protein